MTCNIILTILALVYDLKQTLKLVFFWGQNFTKFQLEKYDFDLYKGFSIKKMTQVHQISKKNSKSSYFGEKL
jgi:hypothetical protein